MTYTTITSTETFRDGELEETRVTVNASGTEETYNSVEELPESIRKQVEAMQQHHGDRERPVSKAGSPYPLTWDDVAPGPAETWGSDAAGPGAALTAAGGRKTEPQQLR